MTVLVKGMEMPKEGCKGCCFVDRRRLGDICPFLRTEVSGNVERGGKPYACPLVEVPTPHGRLIDADEFHQQAGLTDYNELYMDLDEFKAFPTIIEAEK